MRIGLSASTAVLAVVLGSTIACAEQPSPPTWALKFAAGGARSETANGVTTYFGSPSSGGEVATTGAIAAPAVPADPIVDAALKALSDKAVVAKADKDDVEALKAFLGKRSAALWLKNGAPTERAKSVIAEFKKADDFGLRSSDFDIAELPQGASIDAQGEYEARLSLVAATYARQARGGRVDPLSVSNIWDMKPPLKDPSEVLAALAEKEAPGAYLVSLHPKHAGFERLRQALLKARGPQVEEQIDPALKVKLPEDGTLKPGEQNDDIALLRKRLKIEALSATNERLYDARLEAAVRAFQEDKGLKANGVLNAKTRRALNAEGEPKKSNPKGEVDRIVVNMERWRWLPENLGDMYVVNNIPEFIGRVHKGKETIWEERIIIGQPTWPTPILAASMEYIVFRPEWGVPDGIKMKELLPRLKRAGGGGFFDQLFGGGSSGGARVLAAYGLKPSYNGRPVDANSVDWNRVDIRQFSFVQPAGGQNPLGEVKFRFPNRHDVYMHDTTQRALFAQSFRALSHGCIRVQNPRKLAQVLLGEDKGWSADKVTGSFNSGGEVTLTKPVPVYLTYFTAVADETGKLKTYSDLYGHDGRLLSAIAGKAVRYDAPEASGSDIVASAEDDNFVPASEASTKKGTKKQKEVSVKRRSGDSTNDILTNVLSGLVSN